MFDRIMRVIAAAAIFCSVAFAANPHRGPVARPPSAITGGEHPRAPLTSGIPLPGPYSLGPGDSIGFTFFDFETNGSANRNIINFGDGTLSVARMASVDSGALGWLTRGSYYKFFDGTSWSTGWSRVEAVRRGWANIDQIADAGRVEVILSYDGMEASVDSAKGANIWSSDTTSGTAHTWPRMAIGSGLTVHAITTTNPPTDISYAFSPDAGTSWTVDLDLSTTPGTVADADAYDITAQGTKVAAVIAGQGGDIVVIESTDGGVTWTETKIYDIDETLLTPDEIVPDGSVSILYDASGNLHVAWGNYLSIGDGATLLHSVDAPLRHWSNASGVQDAAFPDPDTSIVAPIGRGGNLASQPDISADGTGNVFIVFSRFIRETDVNGNNYEHVFAVSTADGGIIWTDPVDLTPGNGFDASFPAVADLADSYLYIVYNSDPFAGNFSRATPGHPDLAVAVMYLHTMITGVKEMPGSIPTSFHVEQNYPNPFNPTTNIRYSISTNSFVTLKVYDVLGREVATLVNGKQAAGSYGADFDATDLANGTYFYRIQAGSFNETRKMLVLK